MAKIYDDEVLYRVIDALVSANDYLIIANQKLGDGYKDLNSQVRSSTKKIVIEDLKKEIEAGKTFIENMNGLVSNVENAGVENDNPLSIDATLNLGAFSGMQSGESYAEWANRTQDIETKGEEESYDEIIAELKKMEIDQLLALFSEFDLTEEEKIKLQKWIEEENAEAILFLLLKYQKEKEKTEKTIEKEKVDSQIFELEKYFKIEGQGIGSAIDNGLQAIESFLNTNKDNKEAIIGQTFTIAGETVSFENYEEGMEFVNTFKEKKLKELNSLKEQSANLKNEIKLVNKTLGQIDANLIFYDNFTYAYQELDIKDTSLTEFLEYSNEMGFDLKKCSVADALMALKLYYSETGNEDKELNIFSFLDYIRENNAKYKEMSDEKFADEVNIARTDFASTIGQNEKLKGLNDTLYKMMDIDYFYMNEDEKKAYGVVLAKEGKERADYYLEVIEERSLNARKGMALGYETFKDIVSSPGKLMELGRAFIEGGWSGVVGYCDNIYSIATGDYKMTVNDYASQTIQQLFQTMILSYKPVDNETIDEFEKEYGLDAKMANDLRQNITERGGKGEELRYYELLGYLSPEEGGLTQEEVKEYEQMFESIDGGEFYTKYVLKSAYSAGVSTGNMLPSIALGMIPVAGPYLAKVSFWASAAGGTYREQRRSGASWVDAMLAGAIDGALEVGTEYFVGGIPGLSKDAVGIGDFLKMGFAEKALFMGREILGEESEEILQLFGGDYLLSKITGETYDLGEKLDQLPETVISTFMSTLALNSLSYGTQTAFAYGDTMINLTAEDWANLYNEGFNATNFKQMLDNKVQLSLNLNNSNNNPSNQAFTDLERLFKDNGLNGKIEFENGNFKVNDITFNPNEFANLLALTSIDNMTKSSNQEFLNLVKMANNFSQEERIALDKINPNWRNELNVFEARELLGDSAIEELDINEGVDIQRDLSVDKAKIIGNVLSIMKEKYKNDMNLYIQNFIATGNYNSITRNNNARYLFIENNITPADVQLYLEKVKIIENVLSTMKEKYKSDANLYIQNFIATGNYNSITRSNNARYLFIENNITPADVQLYLESEINLNNQTELTNSILIAQNIWKNIGNFFRNLQSSSGNTMGADQGGVQSLCKFMLGGHEYNYREARKIVNDAKNKGLPIPKFIKIATEEYFKLKDVLMDYGFDKDQASIILSSIDDVGACSYAAKANTIFRKFANNPEMFEQRFGFPMYTNNKFGEKVLNSNRLILDMYIFANDKANGGSLFSKNSNLFGKNNTYTFNCGNVIDVFGRKLLNTNEQVYLSSFSGSNDKVLSAYFESKGLTWSSYNLATNKSRNIISDSEFNSYIRRINEAVSSGQSISLGIYSNGNTIRMINSDPSETTSTKSWGEGGGHAVFVIDMNDRGFVVSSWGKEYLIPYSDLKNGGTFTIRIENIGFK